MAVGVTIVTTTALLHVEYDCTVLRGVGRRRRAGLLATSCTLFNLATPGLDNRLPNKIEYVQGEWRWPPPPHASHCGCSGDSVVVLPRLAAPIWGPAGEPEASYRPSKQTRKCNNNESTS